MQNLPVYISIFFALTTLLSVGMLWRAAGNSRTTLLVLLAWLAVQAVVGFSGFYTVTNSVPPRFALLIVPPVLFIVYLFAAPRGRKYIDHLDLKTLTLLHMVRIPVELTLLWLSLQKVVPQLMTFEGRNFDILSGLSAPVIYYLVFVKKAAGKNVLLVWNLVCMGLLANIVINAILSAPFPFQQFAFGQPNIAILYFPFVWLPGCVVPVVLFAHLAALRQLFTKQVV